MKRTELKRFIDENLRQQGSASSMSLAALADELLCHVPCVVHIAENKSDEDGKSTYKITDEQTEINAIIDAIRENEVSTVCMHDKGVTLHFSHIEVMDDMAQCYLTTFDGEYNLTLSNEEGFSELNFTRK